MVKINPNIFRAYDVRGIYPEEINNKTAYLIGRAFVKFLKKPKAKIAVGRDNRLSSFPLFKALVKGITDEGGNVINLGLSTSPMCYFAVAYYKFDGGIQITSSHNPAQYNGFKFVGKKAIPVSADTGLRKIRELTDKIKEDKLAVVPKKKGKILKKAILRDYIKFNLKAVKVKKITPFKIVIDTANAVPGIVVSRLMSYLPVKTYHLFKRLDGRFPNHIPDPLIKENLKFLQREMKDKKADLGVAFDGDGDRIVFVDEKREIVSGDLITALMSDILLSIKPKEKILYDLRSSRIIEDVVKKNKGIPIIYKVGHSFIKEKMRRDNIFFAGELSGHYYLRENYFCEAPFFVLLKILENFSRTGKTMSELIKDYKKYFYSGEINFKVKDKERIVKNLAKKYNRGKASFLDGLRMDFKNWWFNIRPSNTEPLLRLVVEADTKELMNKKKEELIASIIRESKYQKNM